MHIALITLLLIAVTVLGGITAVHAQTPVPDVGQPANGADVVRNPIVATNDTAFSNGIDELAIDILANDIFDGPVNVTLTPDYVDRYLAHSERLYAVDGTSIVRNVARHHETEIIEDVGSARYNGTHLVYTPGVFALSDRMILARYTYTIQDDMGRSDSANITINITRPVASAAVSDMRPDPTFLIAAYSTDPISGRILDDADNTIYNFAGIKSAVDASPTITTDDYWDSLRLRIFSPPVITEGIPDPFDTLFDCNGARRYCALSLITGIIPEFDTPLEPGTYTYQFARTADVNYTGSDVYTGTFVVSELPEPVALIPDPSNRAPVARGGVADVTVYSADERYVLNYEPIYIHGITRDIYAAKAIWLPVSDPDGDDLTITSVTGATLGTVFDQYLSRNTIVYIAGSPGTDIITYTVSDGRGGTATGKITVNVPVLEDRPPEPAPPKEPPNRPPVASDMQVLTVAPFSSESYILISIRPRVADPDGDNIYIENATSATLGPVGSYADRIWYRTNQTGIDTITYTASDRRGGTANSTITVLYVSEQGGTDTITTINIGEQGGAVPVHGSISGRGMLEAYISRGLVAFGDIIPYSGDITGMMQAGAVKQARQLQATGFARGGAAGFLHADVIINTTDTGGPVARAADHVLSEGASIRAASVGEIGNAPPVLSGIDDYTINAQDTLAFRISATDFGGPVYYLFSGAPHGATLPGGCSASPSSPPCTVVNSSAPHGATMSGQGFFSWTPTELQQGDHTITITAYDRQGATDAESFTVRVLPAGTANEPPDAPDVAVTVAPGGQITIMPAISDPDGDPTRIASATGSAGGVIMPSGNSIEYIAGPNPGTETVTYTVRDSRGAESTGTITITIQ